MTKPTSTGRPSSAARGLGKLIAALVTAAAVVLLVVPPLTGWSPW